MEKNTGEKLVCYHCGEDVPKKAPVHYDQKDFCCTGCKTVYQILNQHDMCAYYDHNSTPGITQKVSTSANKFAFLDNSSIRTELLEYSDSAQSQVTWYLPQMHCSSCLWLLENLNRIDPAVHHSRVDFPRKTVTINFSEKGISLRQLAELLASVGYEPHISLNDLSKKPKNLYNRGRLYRLVVAGFSFGNIMMMAFPEYLGLENARDTYDLSPWFRYFSLALSLPVLFYSASEFFVSGWKGVKNGYLNIDAPIALAILITFVRSVIEILSGTGAGYLDSMSGIVFFMLIGRILQDRTQQSLSFDRDYTSYFPIAIHKIENGKETPVALPELRNGDSIIIHNNEIVPADGLLVRGEAAIDYSFVTGESVPVNKKISEIVYAGGRQRGGKIELLLIKDVSQSYLTSLWNRESMQSETPESESWVQVAARYFTLVLFILVSVAAAYWYLNDAAKIWPVVTSALLVACPCALLLSYSFTNGHVLRAYDRKGFYLRNAGVIEKICRLNTAVFDKTGTLTLNNHFEVESHGDHLSREEQDVLASLAAQTTHPLSRAISTYLRGINLEIESFSDKAGLGIEGWHNDKYIKLGSPAFIWGQNNFDATQTVVAWDMDGVKSGFFLIKNQYRRGLKNMLANLGQRMSLFVISGDNESERQNIRQQLKRSDGIFFNQGPDDKLNFIEKMKSEGRNVLMVGDGLNDAGALKTAHVGIAVTEDVNNFSPGCDAILEAGRLKGLHNYLWLARFSKKIVIASFVISILYNVVGLTFAFQAKLSPLVAAILMPASSITIIFLTWLGIEIGGKKIK